MTWGTTEQKRAYNGRVTDAAFVARDDFNGNLVLELSMDADVAYDVMLVLSTGTGWESDDRGKTAHHPTMEAFGERSNIGIVINSLVALIDDGATDLADFLDGKDPRSAASWVGLDCYWEEESYTFKDRDTKKERTGTRMIPTRFNGAKVAKGSKGSKDSKDDDWEAIPRSIRTKLFALADKAKTHDEFVDAVFSKLADEVAANAELAALVNDPTEWDLRW